MNGHSLLLHTASHLFAKSVSCRSAKFTTGDFECMVRLKKFTLKKSFMFCRLKISYNCYMWFCTHQNRCICLFINKMTIENVILNVIIRLVHNSVSILFRVLVFLSFGFVYRLSFFFIWSSIYCCAWIYILKFCHLKIVSLAVDAKKMECHVEKLEYFRHILVLFALDDTFIFLMLALRHQFSSPVTI